jgi:uncharacterized protein (DUF433 family)
MNKDQLNKINKTRSNTAHTCIKLPGPEHWTTMIFERITVEPDKVAGQPCIRGLRIPVATVVVMVADGMTPAEIVAELPDLELEDVAEALHYAAEAVKERELPLRHPA